MSKAKIASCLYLMVMLPAFFPAFGLCREMVLPISGYTGPELRVVRAWEKVWAGKRIDAETIDRVSEFLPASYAGMYRDPAKWGAPPEGFYFFIRPYEPVRETEGLWAATRKYASGLKLAPDGRLPGHQTIAGRPFPRPVSGTEIAWNYEFNTHGDGCAYLRTGYNISPGSRSERVGDQDAWELFWIHRVDKDPRPALPENPKGISRSTFYHMHSPPEFKNTRMFNLRYIDAEKSDDAYMWFSAFRRIQRISTKQRTDSIDGTDLIYDDEYGWDGQILRNRYVLKGKKELLCARHQDMAVTRRTKGQAILNHLSRERTNTYVVEVFNRDPNYIYSKRVWYIDPETYLILWTEMYDESGRFWKCFENITCNIGPPGNQKNFLVGAHYADFQRVHAGIWVNRRVDVGITVSPKLFTVYHLQKGAY